MNHGEVRTVSSTGHALADPGYLDNHYLACQAEYEATLRSVDLKSGWHVLDAGCGSGSFLPLMAELVGQAGKISALRLGVFAPLRFILFGPGLRQI